MSEIESGSKAVEYMFVLNSLQCSTESGSMGRPLTSYSLAPRSNLETRRIKPSSSLLIYVFSAASMVDCFLVSSFSTSD